MRRWRESWEVIIPFFDFSPEVRKIIYTTNMIESINTQLRKVTRNRGHFPSDEALMKVSTWPAKEMGRTTTKINNGRGNGGWYAAINQFDIMFPVDSTWPDPMSRTYTETLTRPRLRPLAHLDLPGCAGSEPAAGAPTIGCVSPNSAA